jgi:predicted nucleotidyltransferase
MDKSIVIKKINANIKNYLTGEYKVLIFGSWARGDALETSDIDIGILGKQKVPWNLMVKILEKTEEIPTLRSIDVIDLNAVDENFRNNALRHAKILN